MSIDRGQVQTGVIRWIGFWLKELKTTTVTQHHTAIYPQTKTEPRPCPSLALLVALPGALGSIA